MRHDLSARAVVLAAAGRAGLDARIVDEIFAGAPLDFPIRFASRLPFFAHRFGMIGITLGGRVWLLEAARELPADALIVLLRHEAEHVRQQRERPVIFFPRYGFEYLAGVIGGAHSVAGRTRFDRAYRGIAYEQEAYAAGERAAAIISQFRVLR